MTLFASSLALAGASRPIATAISGNFRWLVGTNQNMITVQSAPQTLQLKVGSVTYTLNNTYIPGEVTTTYGPGSTTFAVMESGSQPFIANYSATGLVAFDPYAGTYIECKVPMNSAGSIVGNIAIATTIYDYFELMLPPCTAGSYSFPGGLTVTLQALIAGYSLSAPSGTGSSCGTVTFPTGSAPRNVFSLTGTGNGTLSMVGASSELSVPVAGFTTGTGTIFTQANLKIANNSQT